MSDKKRGIARIGTSGIVVPGPKNSFPEDFRSASRLHYYSFLFNTVEINSTFRKIPRAATLQKWSLEVPSHFQFTIKCWREITHVKKLQVDWSNIDTFMKAANHITAGKGCLLVQFPASITRAYRDGVEQILRQVRQNDHKNQWKLAVEFRDTSWYESETSGMLQTVDAAMVLHDMPKSGYLNPTLSEPFAYFRFHGPTGNYRGDYSDDFLTKQSEKISSLLQDGKDVWVYFNNTMGNAYGNAVKLKSLLDHSA